MSISIQKRCICGKSSQFPICDGQHGTLGWRCTPSTPQFHPKVIVSSPHYVSLAEELAFRHGFVSHHSHPEILQCEELIIIHDNDELSALMRQLKYITHHKRRIIGIDCPPSPSLIEMPTDLTFHVQSMPLKSFLSAIDEALNAAQSITQSLPEQIFISHAVADEPFILPAIERLRRQFHTNIFLCADTIPAGQQWHDHIEAALRRSQVLIALCSESFNQSPYCAYEIGFAAALGTPIRPILLYDQGPPAYLQQLNAPSIPRIQRNSPWLSVTDALSAAFFLALQDI